MENWQSRFGHRGLHELILDYNFFNGKRPNAIAGQENQNVVDAEETEQVDEEGYKCNKSSNTDKIDVRRLKSDQFR